MCQAISELDELQDEFCATDAPFGAAGAGEAGDGAEVVEVISNAGIIFALTRNGRCTAFDRGTIAMIGGYSLVNTEQKYILLPNHSALWVPTQSRALLCALAERAGSIQIFNGRRETQNGVSSYYAARVQQVRRRCMITCIAC